MIRSIFPLYTTWVASSTTIGPYERPRDESKTRLQVANWSPGQPDNRNNVQHCLAKYFRNAWAGSTSRFWDDADCEVKKQFICSYDPVFDCPPGWSKYRDSCYLVSNILTTWNSAQAICQVQGNTNTAVAFTISY